MGFLSADSSECDDLDCKPCNRIFARRHPLAESKRKIRPSEKEAIVKQEVKEGLPGGNGRTPHVTEFEDLVDVLPDLARAHRALSNQIGPLEEQKKELASQIDALLDAVGQKSIRGDDWIAIRTADSFTETLKPELLLKLGVTMDQILEATVRTPKKSYVQVRDVKEKA